MKSGNLRILQALRIYLFFMVAFWGLNFPIAGFSGNTRTSGGRPYLLMVTSSDQQLGARPVINISAETVKLLNDSPFDGFSLTLIDIFSAEPVPDGKTVMEKAQFLKAHTSKQIWMRVNMNRIYQCPPDSDRAKNAYRDPGGKAYFAPIKVIDLYDETGALSDFYDMWRRALQFARIMKSGVVFDAEDYNRSGVYRITHIMKAHGKSSEEIIARLRQIGVKMADLAAEEYPDVRILSLFTCLQEYHPNSLGFIHEGILMRAKQKQIPLRLFEGNESALGYVNRDLDGLRKKIDQTSFLSRPWLERFKGHFNLAGVITVWDEHA